MKRIQLIGVPFDLHRPVFRMDATPRVLLPRLVDLPLPWAGAPVLVEPEGLTGEPEANLARVAAVLAAEVRRAWASGTLPFVIGGDCVTAIGTVGGLDEGAKGVIWMEAHGGSARCSNAGTWVQRPLRTVIPLTTIRKQVLTSCACTPRGFIFLPILHKARPGFNL